MRFFISRTLIIYFIAILFFIRLGNTVYISDSNKGNKEAVISQIINHKQGNVRPLAFNLLTVGMITGEVITGFTLAEVLITLLIIGVVASIVVPSLINDTQQAEFKTAWKKTYSDLAQATSKLVSDNGGSLKDLCSASDHLCLRNLFIPYLNYMKVCDNAGNDDCWLANTVVKRYDGRNYPNTFNSHPAIKLNNGSVVFFWYYGNNCTDQISTTNPQYKACGTIFVDVNGYKQPNTVGKDVFGIYLLTNRILPRGLQGDINYGTGCPDAWYGWGCSAVYLTQ